jgi:anti-anti-sigma factor
MRFRIELKDDINLIHPVGNFDGGRDCEQLQALLADMAVSGCRKVIFSFARTRWINSTGVGRLLAAKYHFDQADGRFVLCDFNDRSMSVLNKLRVGEVFEIYDSLPAGIAALRQNRAYSVGS